MHFDIKIRIAEAPGWQGPLEHFLPVFSILDGVLVLCTHIKKLSFLNIKSLKYNFKLIYLIINKNNKNTIGYTVFDKVKIT